MTQAAHSITICEEILDLRTLPIRDLQQRTLTATEDSLKQEWLNKRGKKHGPDSPFVEPVQALLRSPRTGRWTLEHQTRVRSLWSGGTRPQQRLFDEGAAQDNICKACHENAGTDRHRSRDLRVLEPSATVAQLAAYEALWGRGLALDPAKEFNLWDLPSMGASAAEGEFTGFAHGGVYADGCLLRGEYPAHRRGGWAFVQLDTARELQHAMLGPLEGPQCD
ncbi:unnamed protein product [Prorocentrum cordatum]|uniref:Cytochrome c domain-containing protein n=1 Tax=Prorocentrum cordatum TaxID=2364126 RepID=A0ABN9U0G9_9DINO|nr:unnamed protein product [Polarella glacialis]